MSTCPTSALAAWLTFPGSFMQKCREQGFPEPKVSILQEGWQSAPATLRMLFGLPRRAMVWQRDVLIGNGEQRWMLARSVFPTASLKGAGQQFRHLGCRPLGSLLFRVPRWKRTPFEFIPFSPEALWTTFGEKVLSPVWGRRSFFMRDRKTLLLTEIFLPDLEKMISMPETF